MQMLEGSEGVSLLSVNNKYRVRMGHTLDWRLRKMKLRMPSYYKTFHCIADKCKDNCCFGWEIDIDEDTYSYYKNMEGEIGERLRACISPDESHTVRMDERGCCPFLNENHLCDICIHLGEEALSEVCTEYPRFMLEYADVREKFLCLSCEEVGRIVFSQKGKTTFEEMELFEENWGDEEEETVYERNLEHARDKAIEILQNRDKRIVERVAEYLAFCGKVQERIVDESLWEEEVNFSNMQVEGKEADFFSYERFTERLEQLEELEPLNDEWVTEREKMHNFYGKENYGKLHREFLEQQREWEYEQEHLLVYMTFRYFMKAVYDYNFLAKAKFAIFTWLVILDMDVVRYNEHGAYTREDRIDTARIYAKEVEHSEENLEILEEAFEFGFEIV